MALLVKIQGPGWAGDEVLESPRHLFTVLILLLALRHLHEVSSCRLMTTVTAINRNLCAVDIARAIRTEKNRKKRDIVRHPAPWRHRMSHYCSAGAFRHS